MDLSVHPGVVYSVLMTSVSLAAVIDYRRRRIPNWLSFSGWYLGPLLHLIFAGTPGLSASLLGLVLVLLLTFPFFALNWMGAGDVKLMTSVGALVGVTHALLFLASIVITGFVVGVAMLLLRGQLSSFVQRYRTILGMSLATGRPAYVMPESAQQQIVMPYAVSIAIGSLVALCLV